MATDIIGSSIEGGTGIGEIVAGMLIQSETQDKIKDWEKNYPTYDIPQSIQAQLELLRKRAGTGLPGESLIAGQIQQGTAQGVSASREAATSASDLLGATTNLYGQQTNALTSLAIQSAQAKSQNQLAYAQGLGVQGQYEDKAFTWNEAIPWQTKMNQLMGIQQSAYDMLVGGIDTLAQSGASMGGGGTSPTTNSSAMTNTNSNPQGYGVQGVDPAMNNLNFNSNYNYSNVGQNQYNPYGYQTLGQNQYNPSGQTTLGQSMYGGGTWGGY